MITINEILNAKDAIAKLNGIKFNDFKIVSKVYKLTKQLDSVLELYRQEVLKIVKLYAKLDEQGNPIVINNQYQFEDIQHKESFVKEIESIKSSEMDEIEKIDIKLDAIQYANDLTAADMMILEKLINWV